MWHEAHAAISNSIAAELEKSGDCGGPTGAGDRRVKWAYERSGAGGNADMEGNLQVRQNTSAFTLRLFS